MTTNITVCPTRPHNVIHLSGSPRLTVFSAAVTFLCVCGLKIWYQTATINELLWILIPTSKLVSLISGRHFVFLNSVGFIEKGYNILINKGCSGINFLVISVSLGVFTVPLKGNCIQRMARYLQAVLTAYGVTIAANTSRILGALLLAPIQKGITSETISAKLHMAEGMLVYLFFLMVLYFFLGGFLNGRKM